MLLLVLSVLQSQKNFPKINLKNGTHANQMEMGPTEAGEVSSPESEPRDVEALRLKRGHVLAELLETERIYVSELGSIIKGYRMEMNSDALAHLVPTALVGKADVLFGNLEDIYLFHGDTFLKDLENCVSNTELVALCFVQRVSAQFATSYFILWGQLAHFNVVYILNGKVKLILRDYSRV